MKVHIFTVYPVLEASLGGHLLGCSIIAESCGTNAAKTGYALLVLGAYDTDSLCIYPLPVGANKDGS